MKPVKHVAIIMDGNGRWGIKKKNNRNYGHKKGLEIVQNIVKKCLEKNIKYLTLFTFSTENWRRPQKEINFLFSLLQNFLKEKIHKIHKQNIRLKFIGEKKNLNKDLLKSILNAEKFTSLNKKLQINVALNYGSKNEIINSIKKLKRKNLKITEKNFQSNLFTKNIPDPEILIRTGNTNRLSNFMLWQLAYSEIFFEKKLWPDFKNTDFDRILKLYSKITRKFGNVI
jgi:undecaprenyl diphosphate synthase